MNIGGCACGGVNCPHCNPNLWAHPVTIGNATLQHLTERIKELEAVAEKYQELLYQVACKFPNETRHETALRYLKERESPAISADQCSKALLGGGEK